MVDTAKLLTIEVNDRLYLGVLEGNVILDAMSSNGVTKDELARYLKLANLGELQDVTIGGNVCHTTQKLPTSLQIELTRLLSIMEDAKKNAMAATINAIFDDVRKQ